MRSAALLLLVAVPLAAAEPIPIVVHVDRPLHSFDPTTALGATIDAHAEGENEEIFTKPNLDAIASAGFHHLSYRLMTELAGEAWHWNPSGSWSDAKNRRGYWTSSATPSSPIELSYGYRLPRRGNTMDQARNDSYSRIDDGDLSSFWKSNPYLDEHYAGESRPQWILVDLGAVYEIDAAHIAWGRPFAIDYRVQYWPDGDAIHMPQEHHWADFPRGAITDARGGTATLRLSSRPLHVRYLRLLMTRSSHTSATPSADFRDRAGYAVRELWIGRLTGSRFADRMRHGRRNDRQTLIWVSSTDPWHRAVDRDPDVEQPGLDAVFASGLTRGQPMLTPVSLLYGTPDDSGAEIAYLEKRGYAVTHVEMGEEPDGQEIVPEDYAALYRQWAHAIHAIDPLLRLGGPAIQSTVDRTPTWPDAGGKTSWIGRFVDDLRAHDQLDDLNFLSFEWYPFDNLCQSPQEQIVRAPSMLMPVLRGWLEGGVPENIPWFVTEYGYSSYAGAPEVEMYGAMFNAEFVAQFLSIGGAEAYFYGIEPDVLISEARSCGTWGNLLLFLSDDEHHIRYRLPAYWGARMVNEEWALARGGEHMTHETTVARSGGLVTAYSIHRPDGTWAVLVLNKSDSRPERVHFVFHGSGKERSFNGEVAVTQYSPAQYAWHAAGEEGHPTRALPPLRRTISDPSSGIELPPLSITVVSGVVGRE